MRIIFAKNIGFCSGVKRAVAIAEKSLKKDSRPVQFLGSLVHNEEVIKNLKKKGGIFISTLEEIKPGTLILRAHGEILDLQKVRAKKVLIRDTTCPLVKRAQRTANFLFEQGYQVIIIGDKKHPETKGIKRYTKNRALVIENENQAKDPRFLKKVRDKKIGVVAQTTQNLDEANRILKILRNKSKGLKWINTICPEVLIRQKELSQILKKAEGILVVGSRSSANTKRLAEIVKRAKKPAWWINALENLKKQKFINISTLGVVSGTSTPDWEIKRIRTWLRQNLDSLRY